MEIIIKTMQAGFVFIFLFKGRGDRGTEVLLFFKGLPTLLCHFLAPADMLADALMVGYLITIHSYRLVLCTMALQTLLTLCYLQEIGTSFADWEAGS